MEFQIGDVVQLKSGGPLMTIASQESGGAWNCVWFNEKDGAHEPKIYIFKSQVLKKK
ncbi:YodC family protein [Allorhizobium taibaishanense]|uniref:YodC family protein n=1 Tax=Allorhizobium taibaishanense TaxID=887144 RepID=UPI00227714F4|nr:DUF2158 domain-containing protein [Allorhizobium taibaishanense]